MRALLDIFLHLDAHLGELIRQYGTATHLILFAIVFAETGLVVTPFLPGDSLLFAAGTFAALGQLDVVLLGALLIVAAILGDTLNYWVGSRVGPAAFSGALPWLRQAHLERTRAFFARHGAKTIVLARFVPIVRTFAPFVAGVGTMAYPRFLAYNVVGGVAWVVLFTGAGYLFGNIPQVRKNFTLVILGIIVLSVLPIVVEWWKARRAPLAPEAGA
ncbi:MAG: DedA family protein [Gemmatimonadales bacterium]|nr:DedA family protein [Gemmatimonadales bacterium]